MLNNNFICLILNNLKLKWLKIEKNTNIEKDNSIKYI